MKQVIVLVGPKGAGKSTIGDLLATRLGIHFLRVEPLFLEVRSRLGASDPDFERLGFESVLLHVRQALALHDTVCIESTGASSCVPWLLAQLRESARVMPVRVRAGRAECAERIKWRDASIHIPVSDDDVERINEIAERVELPWVAEIDNGGVFNEAAILDMIRSVMNEKNAMPAGTIVSARELKNALESGEALVLLDARKDRATYESGHLPGALFADCNEHLSSANDPGADAARGGRHPLPPMERWCRTLGEWGITPSTNVIIYDDQAGANSAARAWWMLRAIGHEAVRVLDGGIAAAIAEGVPLTTAPANAQPLAPYPAHEWLRPVVDIDTVDALREDRGWKVLDVRSASRFAGLEEPIDPIAGHIPGAVNLPFTMNLEDGLYKTPGELRAMYEELLSGVPPDRLIVHCGSGVTACHTLLALEIAGIGGASLYVGSWSEWCRNPRPRAEKD